MNKELIIKARDDYNGRTTVKYNVAVPNSGN